MFYTAKVKVQSEDEKTEKVKSVTEQYLVEAESVTDAEAAIYKRFEGWNLEFKVIAVSKSNILEVVYPVKSGTKPKAKAEEATA